MLWLVLSVFAIFIPAKWCFNAHDHENSETVSWVPKDTRPLFLKQGFGLGSNYCCWDKKVFERVISWGCQLGVSTFLGELGIVVLCFHVVFNNFKIYYSFFLVLVYLLVFDDYGFSGCFCEYAS